MKTASNSVIKTLLIVFLVFAGLHFAKDILIPVFIGGLLATIFLPMSKWMESRRIPRGLAVLICLLIFLFLIFGMASVLGWQISELKQDFPFIKAKTIETYNYIQEYIFTNLGITGEAQMELIKAEQPSIGNLLQIVGGSVINILTSFVLILAYIFCFLYYRSHIKSFLIRLAKTQRQGEVENVIYRVTNVSQQYLVGLMKMIACLWVMYGIGFSLIGVKNALLFAVICGILEIVPFIGNFTGTTLTVFVAAVQGGSLPLLVAIVITYIVVQLIQGWILEPLILGPQVKINPFSTIVSLVIGEMVWGLPGIFLAIPLTAMLKIIFDHIDVLKPYGFLIGEVESGPGIARFQKVRKYFGWKIDDDQL